jgi:hypothetical protein
MAGNGFGISFNGSNIAESMQNFNREMQEKAMRPAAFDMCTVLYQELQLTVPKDDGTMLDALYRFRNPNSGAAVENWTVGVNQSKAPHFHLIEEGHWQPYKVVRGADGKFYTTSQLLPSPKWIPPNAFFRAAYDAKIGQALNVGLLSLKNRIAQMV